MIASSMSALCTLPITVELSVIIATISLGRYKLVHRSALGSTFNWTKYALGEQLLKRLSEFDLVPLKLSHAAIL